MELWQVWLMHGGSHSKRHRQTALSFRALVDHVTQPPSLSRGRRLLPVWVAGRAQLCHCFLLTSEVADAFVSCQIAAVVCGV